MAPKMKVETSQSTSAPKVQAKAAVSATQAPKPAVDAPKSAIQAPKPKVDTPAQPAQPAKPAQAKPKPAQTKPTAGATKASKPKVSARVVYEEPASSSVTEDAANASSQAAAEAASPGNAVAGARRSVTGWVKKTFPGHEHAFWGGVIALVIVLLAFVIGPLRMLLVCLVVLVGVAVGQILDGDPKIIRMVRGLFDNDLEQR